MEYKIVFAPDLPVDSQTFIEAWNADPDHSKVAAAKPVTEYSKGLFDPSLADGAIALIGTLTIGIVTNALYDMIKMLMVKQGITVETEYMELTQPDGTRLVVIKKKEG